MPFDIPIFIVQCARSDFEKLHRHPWADFGQLNAGVPGLNKHVVSYFDAVFNVLECHRPVANLAAGFPGRKHVLQDLDYPVAERRAETLEYEMWVCFADSAARRVRNIRPQHDVVQGERGCRSMRKMRYGEGSRGATMLVKQHNISQVTRLCSGNEIGQDCVSSIDANGSRQKQSYFLGESLQPRRGVPRCGDQNPRISNATECCILVVQLQFFGCRPVRLALVEPIVLMEGLVFCDLWV